MKALGILQTFSKASGLNLNFNKCELLPIKDCSLTSIEDIAVKNRVTYLGILITKDEYRCSANFKPIITKTHTKYAIAGYKGSVLFGLHCSVSVCG